MTPAITARMTFWPRIAGALLGLLMLGGCQIAQPIARTEEEQSLFGPVKMRIHPTFTQIKDWNNNGQPDGIEAELEFLDQFDDPTKAEGQVLFNLYNYVQSDPDHRGERVATFKGSLLTLEEQRSRWDRTSRTYKFRLTVGISRQQDWLLEAEFEHVGGRRLFGRWFYQAPLAGPKSPQPSIPPLPTSAPATMPTSRHTR